MFLYIDHYRPLLVAGESEYLFPGAHASVPKSYEALRMQIEKVLAERVGIQYNLHGFRHLMAYNILKANPGAHGLVQRNLGHRNLYSMMAFYSGLEQAAAREHHDGLLSKQRRSSGSPDRARRR